MSSTSYTAGVHNYVNPLTGEQFNAELKAGWDWTDGYQYNNMFRTSNAADINVAVGYFLKHGWKGEEKQNLLDYLHDNGRESTTYSELDEIIHDAQKYLNERGIKIQDLNDYYDSGGVYYDNPEDAKRAAEERKAQIQQNAQQEAYDEYYNDLYSLNQGTFGREMLDNYTLAEQNAAMSNMQLAEAQYQQAAMQQAETVKAITDSVKAERMARLRAGMSESQIANQDMQTMLTNMNTLNQNMDTLNQNRLAAQQQYNLAQDTAYQQYIQSLTGLGGTSAAFAAAAAGNPDYIAQQYAKNVNRLYTGPQYKIVSTGNTGNTSS